MNYVRVASSALVSGIIATAVFLLPPLVKATPVLADAFAQHLQAVGTFTAVLLWTVIYFFYRYAFPRTEKFLDSVITHASPALHNWSKTAPLKSIYPAIVILSGATLFLELVLIRWQASLFPVFALYKNFTLLACFCGLGIGYALAKKNPLLLPATLPLLAVTLLVLTALRHMGVPEVQNLLFLVPVQEEKSVLEVHAANTMSWFFYNLPLYGLLVGAFILNVLVMIPIAQYCGHVMNRVNSLSGYGCNLLGSIAGVAALFFFSWMWTGPVVWFGFSAAMVLWYQLSVADARRTGIAASLACVLITAWPVEPLIQSIYSPYQLIQKASKPDGYMEILAAGTYYQKVFDLSMTNKNRDSEEFKGVVGYYELPFRTATSLNRVVVVGAGSGNDVAAGVRVGAKMVEAVEIDPAIMALGRMNHPEHPYDNPHVTPVNDDARTFFRRSTDKFDAIVYGVLDSHILLSHGSNVRLDSFVYTKEGLTEAYNLLKNGGLMSVSFALPNLLMGQKIFSMLSDMPGAGKPVAVLTGYDNQNTYTFMVRKKAEVKLPQDFMDGHYLTDHTADFAGQKAANLVIPTDDWPFFYMDAKMYPATYVVSLVLVMALALFMVRGFLPEQKWNRSLLPFFFLGAGFMLVETKAITELGLIFGNTWQVIGITITGVLVMAFAANVLVSKMRFKNVMVPYALLLLAIAFGYALAARGGLPHAGFSAKLFMIVILTCPLLFSGIVFSTLLAGAEDIASVLAYNLMGAMLGGLLEYNSMQFGFAFLYLIALGLYAAAWITTKRGKRGH
ncbi:MAG: hypothetical protein ACAH83_10530 [Alphaproteobacteria bacterium]